jgi:hypothetical protein
MQRGSPKVNQVAMYGSMQLSLYNHTGKKTQVKDMKFRSSGPYDGTKMWDGIRKEI